MTACRRGHVSNRDAHGHCRDCKSINMKTYYAGHKAKLQAKCLLWRTNYPDKKRASDMKVCSRRYKYPEPTRPEASLCECCGKPDSNRRLSLDHCHSTGTFRGWLCKECNMGMGKLGDTVEGLRQAIAYLERAYAN